MARRPLTATAARPTLRFSVALVLSRATASGPAEAIIRKILSPQVPDVDLGAMGRVIRE